MADYVATGKVVFEYYPVAFLDRPGDKAGPESTQAAEAALCALDQGKFWAYHDTLFANQGQENSGAFSKSRLKEMAKVAGLDTGQFNDCLDSGKHRDEVQKLTQDAVSKGVTSTPSVEVNGKLIDYNGYASVRDAIEAALKQ